MNSMNSSSFNYNVSSSLNNREAASIAAVKNVIVVALGLIISYINGTLIHTFRKHSIFYMNPRYILFIHLVLNDIIQLIIAISLFVFSYIFHTMNASICCFIITFSVFTTLNTPLNLAVMAVECYIAVCFPLRHAELCTIKRIYILIGCIWILSSLSVVPDIFILLATDPLWLFYSTIFCDLEILFKHPASTLKRDIFYILYFTVVWLTLIFTYFKIFFAAHEADSVDGKKARNTILLHGFQLLLCMLTFVFHIMKNYIMLLFPKYSVQIHFALYIFVHVLPRLISPIVYGLRDKTFKQYFKKYMVFCPRKGNELYPSSKKC